MRRALEAEGKRTATVRAKTQVQAWVMDRAKFTQILQRWPVIAFAMVNILSERLDATNNASFRDLTEKNHALQRAYDDLKAAQAQLVEKERLERELERPAASLPGGPGHPARAAELTVPPFFQFGSWIGGDRDGNPFVTAEALLRATTRQAETALISSLMSAYALSWPEVRFKLTSGGRTILVTDGQGGLSSVLVDLLGPECGGELAELETELRRFRVQASGAA